jgi:hypothetical protein
VVGVCVALSACGAAGKSSRHDHIGHMETVALATRAPSKHCIALTAARLERELVPNTPCMIVLTRYAGLPAQIGAQVVGRVKLQSPSLLQSLTSEFDALPFLSEGVRNCPSDRGSEIVADLKYPHYQYLQLTITLTGCSTARRGPVTRSALGRSGEKLIGRLERLLAQR